MITKSQLINGMAGYAETELLPHQEGWKLFAGAAAINLAKLNANKIADTALSNGLTKTFGIVSENGLIDIDTAYHNLKQACAPLWPLTVELKMFGEYTFKEKDLDAVYRILKKLPKEELPEE